MPEDVIAEGGLAAEAEMELRICSSWLSTLRCLLVVLFCTDSLSLLLALFSKFAQFANDLCTGRPNQLIRKHGCGSNCLFRGSILVIDGLWARSLIEEVFRRKYFCPQVLPEDQFVMMRMAACWRAVLWCATRTEVKMEVTL